MLKKISHILLAFLCACPFARSEEISLGKDQENISNLLNLAQVSIQTISTYNNRLILDREYNSIINNINLRNIPDSRLVDLLNELLDALLQAKLTDRERERIDVELQRGADQLLKAATSGVASGACEAAVRLAAQDYFGALTSSVSAVGAYWDYQQNCERLERGREDQNWEIDNQVFVEINQINKKLLTLCWELYNEYEIPDYRRLTSEDIQEIIDVGRVGDSEKRLRLLNQDHLKNKFSFYPPYWYYLGLAAHQTYSASSENELRDLAMRAYGRYGKLAFAILKKDEMLASAQLGLVQLLDQEQNRAEILELLAWLNNHPPRNWVEITTLAICFEKVGDHQNAIKWAQYNVDREKTNNFFHQKVLARILLNAGNRELADQTISQMLDLKEAIVVDVLQMMGPKNIDIVASRLEPTINSISLMLQKRKFLSDSLRLQIPKSLHLKDGKVYIEALGYRCYDPLLGRITMKDGVALYPNNVKFDQENDLVIFDFSSREIDQFVDEEHDELMVHFASQEYPISILHILDQSLNDETSAASLRKEFVSIGAHSYVPNASGLVGCSDVLERQFKESANGFLYNYVASESSSISLQAFDEVAALESLIANGKKAQILNYIKAALKDHSINYWDIIAALENHGSILGKLDLIPQDGIYYEQSEGMITQINDLGEAIDGESSFGKFSNKIFKSEAVSEKLNAPGGLELKLGGRWKAREDYDFKLVIGGNKFDGNYSFNANRKQPVTVVFEDCYSQESWREGSVKSVMLEVAGTALPVKLIFSCTNNDHSQLTLEAIKLL